jgi:hydroxyethylthiazole kinase-like uncharacterized protein yjeF
MMHRPTGPILTAAEMRAAELAAEDYGVSLAMLMERAGKAVADAVVRFSRGRPVLILCGPGNNGGDGYVAARLLMEAGVAVRVAAFGEPRTDLAKDARAAWTGPVEDARTCEPAAVLVDALFGTGLTRAVEGEVASHYWDLAKDAETVIAVDLPSGLDTDHGACLGAARAHVTVALGALKPAHLLEPGSSLCGAVLLARIGIPAWSDAHVLRRPSLYAPAPDSHKYKRGYAVVAGGAMGGAAMLSARAAMRLAGYVALTGAKRTGPEALVHRRWEDVAEDKRVGALLIGPGLGRDEAAHAKLDAALATSHKLVLDADALMLLTSAERDALGQGIRPCILTPHEGEFQALFGRLPGSKIERARAAAALSGAVVVLKGADTVIASPEGRVAVASGLPGWLASAGTGDVLAGLCVAALAGSDNLLVDAFDAACTAVWLHGEAARRAGPALIADDLPDQIQDAVRMCL